MQTNEGKSGRHISLYAPYVIIIMAFILTGGFLFYITYENVKRETIDNLNARQMLHARQAAKGIEAFFDDHIRLLESLAKDPDIISLNPEGRKLMREFQASHAGEISIISRTDRQGRIVHPEPYDHSKVGQSVISINDFLETKRTKRVVISDVFTNRRGSKTIIIHVPVFKNGSFDGTLAVLLPFDVIAKRYVQDIRIGQDGYAWVISKGGTELSCPVPGHEGNSVLVNCKDFPDILAMAEKMMRGEQGITTYTFDRVRGSKVSKTIKHAVYMPINLRNQFWSIVVATPEDEALSPLEGFRNRMLLIALIFSIGMIFYIYTLLKNRLLADEVEQRKQTEAELRIKTDELDRYFTSSLDLLCIADIDGYFRRLNPEWERTLGYPLVELEGTSFFDLIHPDDIKATTEAVGQLAESKEVLSFVNRYRHRDGSYRFIEWKSYPVGSMIYAVARDITNNKITEDKISNLVAHQEALLAAIPDIIMEVDSNKIYRWANKAGLEFFGEDAIGKSADFYFSEEQSTYESVQPIFNGSEDVVYVESRQRRRDGEKRLLAWWCRVIKDSNGIVTGALSSARDITDDRAREEELRESRRQLADIISFLPDATMVIDRNGIVIAWNRAIEDMTGVKAEEMIGRGDYEYALPFYGERRPILIDLALHPDSRMETRYTAIHRFGDILFGESYTPKLAPGNVHLSATASVLRDSRGEIIAAIECIRNNTERKLADDALKESERRMADIINFLPDAALVIDKDGYVIAWNRAIEEMTGIKAGDVLGKGNFEYALPFYGERRPILIDLVLQPREEIEGRYRNIKWQGGTLVGEAYMPSLRGKRSYLLGTASPLYNTKGAIVGAIETIRDITDRRQMEETLSSEREQLASTLDGIPVPGFVIDKECKVTLWNRSNEVYTGRPKESMLGKKIDLSFLFKGKDSPSLAEIILTMQDEEIIRKYGHRGVNRSEISPGAFESVRTIRLRDEERIMSIQAARIYNPQGEIIGAVQTAQDITERIRAEAERKHLQDQLNQAQKLEAIGTLAGGIAHDFNNMLAAIIGYTELTIDEPDEKMRRRKLNEVLKASKKAKDLVRQILTFSRNTEQEKKPLDMKLVTKEALKLLRSTLPATVEIRQNLTADPCMINADLTQMHQIIMNLCTNAAQAMGERGGVLEVNLSLEYIKDSILRQHPDAVAGPYVRMTVSDTGQGIDPAIKDRIFEPFFTTKGIGEGTGLGLSVVYGIVKNHGGIITAESEHGYKTAFDVYLPAIGSTEPREEASVPEDVPQGSERILLVDDDQTLLAMGKLMLESLGYTVDVRTSGMEALGSFLADSGFYDLVITDMTMPLMTGSELAVEFLRIRPDIPIILCTGFSEFIDEEKAKDIGLKAFVMKPFSKKTIGRIVREVLDK